MKFGKEFESQMVPEWQEAYMDYDYLKKLLKEALMFRENNVKPAADPQSGPVGGLKRKLTLYRAFSGLTQRANNNNNSSSNNNNDIENQAILVSSVNENGSQSYQTAFLMASDEGGEYELVYFRRLDDEFNKVNSFYKSKVDEVLKEADTLNKQMDALIAFRIKVENPTGWSRGDQTKHMTRLASDVAASAAALEATTPSGAKTGSLFCGCIAALIIAIFLIIRARNIMNMPGRLQYMETMFPLYSLFGFIVLHIVMYAANIYLWKRFRVNYSFIFGFKSGTELGFRQVLLVAFGIAVLALCSVLSNLDMEMDPVTKDYQAFTELVPLALIALLLIIMFLPLNILYRSSRFFFLTCIFHCIAAPLYKVTLPDFFLADQLTSQVQAIRSLEFYVCYYGWGDFKRRENTCRTSGVYNTFYFIVAVIPFVARLLQCLRRLFEEKDATQGINGLKYFVTILAVTMRTAHSLNRGVGWRLIAWVFSAIAAIFGTYWDLVHDWGLLKPHSKNWLLRDKLILPFKSVYYIAMVVNVLLRFAWLQTVLNYNFTFLHRQTLVAVVASLEIIRRGIWNFFRIENEHLNNVGKFRAFKSVPLPFNYDEEDDDKDE